MFPITNILLVNRIKKVLARANIDIVHFIPGRIRLKCLRWKNNSPEAKEIICRLNNESKIKSLILTHETGTLLVEFDSSVLNDLAILEGWVGQVEQTIFHKG